MIDHVRGRTPGALYLIRSRTACSPRLQAALRAQHGGFYAVGRTRGQPAAPGQLHISPRHVPQFLPQGLYDRHMSALCGISAKLLRRAACFKLFELAGGGNWMDAADYWQIPHTTARSTLAFVRRWTKPNLTSFDNAVASIARELQSRDLLINYHARRKALADWSIPEPEWLALVSDLTAGTRRGRPAIYDHRKHLIASAIVWAQVTEGEHLFAPLVMAEKTMHGHSDLRVAITSIITRSTPRNADLRVALACYAERVAADIDGSDIKER
jgi:hypothetical protein